MVNGVVCRIAKLSAMGRVAAALTAPNHKLALMASMHSNQYDATSSLCSLSLTTSSQSSAHARHSCAAIDTASTAILLGPRAPPHRLCVRRSLRGCSEQFVSRGCHWARSSVYIPRNFLARRLLHTALAWNVATQSTGSGTCRHCRAAMTETAAQRKCSAPIVIS